MSLTQNTFRYSITAIAALTFMCCLKIYGQTKLNPVVIQIDTCPKPQIVTVPAKSGGHYLFRFANEYKEFDLEPPVTVMLDQQNAETQGYCFFTNYTSDNGLALDHVVSSYKDRMGNLWFGTSGGGLSRFDGKIFTNFTTVHGLVNNFVLCITGDDSGNIWFGTSGGVSCYDGKSFINYTKDNGLADNMVMCSAKDKYGNIWFGTEKGGVSRFDGKSFTTFNTTSGLPSNIILSIAEDSRGNLWFGTMSGASRYDGKSFVNITKDDGLIDNTVRCISEDENGIIWISTLYGICRYDGSSYKTFTTDDGLVDNRIRCSMVDRKGNIWLGTNNGVSCFDGKSFINFTTAQGLAGNRIRCITSDEEGNIWFGTNGSGVSRYGGKAFSNFTTSKGLSNNIILSIAEDKTGKLWFGTYGGGVNCYDGKSFTHYTIYQGLSNNSVISIADDRDGSIWFGTYGNGVSRFDGKTFTNYTNLQGLPGNSVWCIKKDRHGNLWFGTEGGGAGYFDGKTFTNFTTNQGLASNIVRSIHEDSKGNLWFGTTGGVSCFDGKSFVNFTTAEGLANNTVWCISEDSRNNLWIGTELGVSRYDGNSIVSYTTRDGLSDNVITNVLEDKDGKIYLGTNKGINVITAWENNTPVIEIYNWENGYPVKDINMGQNAMLIDSKGVLWAGTGADKTGLARIDFKEITRGSKPIAVVLQKIKVNNENISWQNLERIKNSKNGNNKDKQHLKTDNSAEDSVRTAENSIDSINVLNQEAITYNRFLTEEERERIYSKFGNIEFDGISKFYPLPENLVLPYINNNITIEFAGIELSRPFSVKYKYKLEGYDDDWNPVTERTSASFGNIREGTYTFKIKASRSGGAWSDAVAYTFKVLPPWYRTWWAYVMYVLLLILMVISIIKIYTRVLVKQKAWLEETVRQRSLELEDKVQSLSKINAELNLERIKLRDTNHELESFAYSVSHDLHAPLRHIIGFSDKLKKNLNINADSEADKLTDKILSSGMKMNSLIDNLLKYSRLGRMDIKKQKVSLDYIVDDIIKDARDSSSKRNVEWKVNHLPEVQADQIQIRLVFQNLIENAIKYTGKKEKAVIEIDCRENGGEGYVFSVKDNGAGFNMKYADKLFGIFQRLHSSDEFEGTGIGLANIRRIISRHGGRVWAEGVEDEGATFYFTLPK